MSQTDSVVIEHLQAALDALLQERLRLGAAITGLMELMRIYGADAYAAGSVVDTASLSDHVSVQLVTGSGAVGAVRVAPVDQGPPVMREAILRRVHERGTVKAGETADVLARRHGWSPASVRSAMSKMAQAGELYQPARGIYAVPGKLDSRAGSEASTDAEAPADTGASESEESDRDSSWKEGGSAYGAVPPVGRDDSGDTELSHGHGHRASIMEATG
jgi:hypothetical protein